MVPRNYSYYQQNVRGKITEEMYDLCPNQICFLLRIVENEVRGTESVNSSNIYCCVISADFLGLPETHAGDESSILFPS